MAGNARVRKGAGMKQKAIACVAHSSPSKRKDRDGGKRISRVHYVGSKRVNGEGDEKADRARDCNDKVSREIWMRAHSFSARIPFNSWEKRIKCVNARLARESKYISILSVYSCNEDIPVGEPQCADCSSFLDEGMDDEGFKCAMCAGSVGHCGITYDSDSSTAVCGHCLEMV